MANYRFRYNPETLRYERRRISFWNVAVAVLATASFSFLLLAGLLYLQYQFAGNSRKHHRRAENAKLIAGQPAMRQQLDSVRLQVAHLAQQEAALFTRLFGIEKPQTPQTSRAQLLTLDGVAFNRTVRKLTRNVEAVQRRAAATNLHFFKTVRMDKTDIGRLRALPTLFPVQQVQAAHVASGFGSRLNPWHKGHYHHQGIDIVQPRGAPVLATASGTVQLVKRSDRPATATTLKSTMACT